MKTWDKFAAEGVALSSNADDEGSKIDLHHQTFNLAKQKLMNNLHVLYNSLNIFFQTFSFTIQEIIYIFFVKIMHELYADYSISRFASKFVNCSFQKGSLITLRLFGLTRLALAWIFFRPVWFDKSYFTLVNWKS